jgi:hypothetical protein
LLEKFKNRYRPIGAVSGDTTTIASPANPADVSSSVDIVVVNGVAYTQQEKDEAKKYAALFKKLCPMDSPVASFMIHQYLTCKLIVNKAAHIICDYNPRDIKNAYCAFRLECDDNPIVFIEKLHAKTLLNHYYEKLADEMIKSSVNSLKKGLNYYMVRF